MSYTTDDLAAIRLAKLKLATGDRVGEFSHGGTKIRYAEVTMADLDLMEAKVTASLTPRRRQVRILGDKGL